MEQTVRRVSLVDAVTEGLRAELAAGTWKVGAKLPVEAALAERFGVSKGTVRQSVAALAASGLLAVRQGAGTFVSGTVDAAETGRRIRRSALRDQFEVRCALEAQAARLAAVRAEPGELQKLRSLLGERGVYSGRSEDHDSFVAADFRFHQGIVAASHNPALAATYRFLADAIQQTIASTLGVEVPEPDLAEHLGLVDAIAAGNPDGADAAVRRFMAPMLQALGAQG